VIPGPTPQTRPIQAFISMEMGRVLDRDMSMESRVMDIHLSQPPVLAEV
jgi:hypothetical protein